MKKTVWIIFFVAAAMLLMPLSVMQNQPEVLAAGKTETKVLKADESTDTDTFRLYDSETEKITVISREDYIFGVVAAEMPALYEPEALKAQAIAAYTYACFYREQNKNEKYDLTTDPSNSQSFITEEAAKAKWGSKAEEYTSKIKSAIEDVGQSVITYDGDVILAVYHAISSGKTEDSANVWGKEYPYLKSVDSKGDTEAENYETTISFTSSELKEKLSSKVKLSGEAKDWLGKITATDSSTVKQIALGGTNLSGSAVRECLELRSSCFTVEFKDDKFTFTVHGYGHGVGMSQYGANYLAKQGKDCEEILLHYYTECKIEK